MTTDSSAQSSSPNVSWWNSVNMIPQTVSNTGSIARDILASERTFLAWSRTGLGFVGAGTALFAAFHEQSTGRGSDETRNETTLISTHNKKTCEHHISWMEEVFLKNPNLHWYPTLAAALLVGNGAFLLAFATRRYLRTVTLLTREIPMFPIDTRGTLWAVAVTSTSTVASLGLVLSTTTQIHARTYLDRPTTE